MQKLVWQNANGVELDLTSGNYGITEWEGFSNASLNIQQQQVPFQDGGVFLDALIEQRELSVTLAMQDNNNLELRYQQRRELISALNPKLGEGYLIYTNDFISKRIKCVPQIPLFETHNSDTAGTPKASLSWTACEPYWEDLEETVVELPLGEEVTIENTGDVPIGIEVQIDTASIGTPQISNLTTGKTIALNKEFDGNILIDTKVGEKKAQNKETSFVWNSGSSLVAMAENNDTQVFLGRNIIHKKFPVGEYKNFEGTIQDFFTDGIYFAKGGFFIGLVCTNTKVVIYISQDGNKWEEVYEDTNTSTNDVTASIVYAEYLGKLFAVYNANLYTSLDGITWTKTSSAFANKAMQITCAENIKELCVVTSGYKCKSFAGDVWNQASFDEDVKYVTYSEDMTKFVATTGAGTFYTTGVGVTSSWAKYENKESVDNIIYIKEKKLFYGNKANVVYTSTNGVDWVVQATVGVVSIKKFYWSKLENCLYAIGLGCICVLGENDSWNIITNSVACASILCIRHFAETNKYVVGAGNSNTNNYMISSDFKNWQLKTIGETNQARGIYAIDYSPSLEIYCALCGDGIYISQDLDSWTRTKPFLVDDDKLLNFVHQNVIWVETLGLFVVCGRKKIYASSDGTTWTTVFTETQSQYSIIGIAWAEDKQMFVANANLRRLYTSADGINWTSKDVLPTNIGGGTIIYVEDLELFCICGAIATPRQAIATSSDTDNWNVTVLEQGNLYGITYSTRNKTLYVAGIGSQAKGVLYASRDGKNWVAKDISGCYKQGTTTVFECYYDDVKDCVLIGGYDSQIQTTIKTEYQNAIGTLSQGSDMGLALEVGENTLRYNVQNGGGTCTLRYKQKYIGV